MHLSLFLQLSLHTHPKFQVCQTVPTFHRIILLPSVIAQNRNYLLTESRLRFVIISCKILKPIVYTGTTLSVFPHTLWIFPNDWRCITLHLQLIRQVLSNTPMKLMGVNKLVPAEIRYLTSEVAVEYLLAVGLVLKIEGFYCHLENQMHPPDGFQMQNPEFHMDWKPSVSANPSCESAIVLWWIPDQEKLMFSNDDPRHPQC